MSRQILDNMILATLLAPGKVYIYFLSILFLFVLMTIIPQILDIFDESYPLPPSPGFRKDVTPLLHPSGGLRA